jgi:endonuclease YncB( thermonuclease family)
LAIRRPFLPGRAYALAVRAFMCLLALLAACLPFPAAAQAPSTSATVLRVVEGDTVDVITAEGTRERVRLIGIDAPAADPPVMCFGIEARQRARELLPEGAAVVVEMDAGQGERDRYGRLLAYLLLDTPDGPVDVGEALIADGFAREYTYPVTYTRQEEFREAAALARDQERGLWAACGGLSAPGDLDGPLRALLSGVQDAAGPIVVPQGLGAARACPGLLGQLLAPQRGGLSDADRPDADRDGGGCESARAPRDLPGR